MMTKKENKVLLLLLKDYNTDYNANSISKVVDISPRGALKLLNRFEEKGVLKSKKLGKALFFKINFDNKLAINLTEAALIEEKEKYGRWVFEFEELFKLAKLVILFGSVIRKKDANDIDLLIVLEQKDNKKVNDFIKEKNRILTKRIHPLKQTILDLEKNLKNKDKVLLSAIKEGIVLYGQDLSVGVIKNVSRFE